MWFVLKEIGNYDTIGNKKHQDLIKKKRFFLEATMKFQVAFKCVCVSEEVE